MLTNLFSKTKPINYLIILVLLFLSYVLFQFPEVNRPTSWSGLFVKIILFVILFLTIFFVHFISQKNNLTRENNYASLLFVLFLFLFPSILVNSKIIISNFFIILALRRIFSMHSSKDSKKKIFDASLWIFVASIFHFWSILFLILLFLSMFFYGSRDYKNWLIPIISFICVFVFLSIFMLVSDIDFFYFTINQIQTSFDFTYFENIYQNIALSAFTSLSLLFFVSQIIDLPKKQFNKQTSYKKLLVAFMIGACIYIISADKHNGTLLFTFFPLSILGANYIDNIPTPWFKETILWIIVSISLFIYVSQLLYF